MPRHQRVLILITKWFLKAAKSTAQSFSPILRIFSKPNVVCMKMRYILGVVSVAVLAFASCGKKTGGCYKGEKAVVKDFSESDTCGIVFQLEDGTKLEATNLAEFPGIDYSHGSLVWVSYKPASGASTCGIGEIVELRCVSERDY